MSRTSSPQARAHESTARVLGRATGVGHPEGLSAHYWAGTSKVRWDRKVEREAMARRAREAEEARLAAMEEAYFNDPAKLTPQQRQQRESELPQEERRRVVSGVALSSALMDKELERRRKVHLQSQQYRKPSIVWPVLGGATMGAAMGGGIALLHTVMAGQGRGLAKFRGFGKRAGGMMVMFGTIFGVGSVLRAH